MKKLAIMSDLHVDVNHFTDHEITTLIAVLQAEKIDHLHLAGDIANDLKTVGLPFIERLKKYCSVTFNLGNHDMLGLHETEIQAHEAQVIELDGVSLIATAGWYDYSFNPAKTEAEHLASKNFYWFDRKLDRSASDPELTQQSLQQLELCLKKAQQPVIVAMHFVPHADFIVDHPYFQRFNAFLGSQAYHELFVRYRVPEVVFGHLHHEHDRIIDGVHYQARPLGYKREWELVDAFFNAFPKYRIKPMYHLSKRYRAIQELPEFQAFYQQYLVAEFRHALTIFSI